MLKKSTEGKEKEKNTQTIASANVSWQIDRDDFVRWPIVSKIGFSLEKSNESIFAWPRFRLAITNYPLDDFLTSDGLTKKVEKLSSSSEWDVA